MADKQDGFFKRMFRFGRQDRDLEKVEDETTDTALGTDEQHDPVAHAEAAATVVADSEAGADVSQPAGGIEPIKDTPPPSGNQTTKGVPPKKSDSPEASPAPGDPVTGHVADIVPGRVPGHENEPFPDPDAKPAKPVVPVTDAPSDGVFEAPGETHSGKAGDTAVPLTDTPEPPPPAADPEHEHDFPPSNTETGKKKPAAEPFANAPVQRDVDRVVLRTVEPAADTALSAPPKVSWFKRMGSGLSRTSSQLTTSISGVFTKRKLDEDTLEELEDILIRADLGVATATAITDRLADQRMGRDVTDEDVRTLMAEEVERVLTPVAGPLELDLDHQPHVILVVGVNGSGKTTTIGKLGQKLYDAGFSTLLVAGDTFRAAAVEQLKIWGERTLSPVIYRPDGADAAGLAYDAYVQARDEGRDVVLMDTAGRLQNKTELMAELEKIIRVFKKLDPSAPHTVLLTLDATTGQNALNQVEIFKDVAGVNGLVMTKLDGTARGGILVGIAAKYGLPVYFIGVGEQVEDLEPFDARDFARSISGLSA